MEPRKPTTEELEDIFGTKKGTLHVREIDEPLEWFKQQMATKLRENNHKGGWDQEPIDYLIYRLQEETDELIKAIISEPPENVIFESADVGNFAMMIADIYRKRMKANA